MRRFIGKILVGLGIVAVGVAGTAAYFRDVIREGLLSPRIPFQVSEQGATPDYQLAETWAARPGRLDMADLSPRAAIGGDAAAWGAGDVFFIHDTTYASAERWNGPIDAEAGRQVDEVAMPNQASAFGSAGRIYAPRYRQATLYTFRTRSTDSRSARLAAYKDVRRAFRNFLREREDGRPLVLAGHGQGALHGLGLLEDLIADTPLQTDLVAAYLIGHPLPLDLFNGPLATIPPCREARQTGCVVSWVAYLDGQKTAKLTDRALVWDNKRLTPVLDSPILCTNPLSWRADELPAGSDMHVGAMPLQRYRDSNFAGLVSAVTSAQCQGGLLKLTVAEPDQWELPLFAARRNHQFDINLVYGDIRENAALRVRTFHTQRANEQQTRTILKDQTSRE